jgi:hypothetical protein
MVATCWRWVQLGGEEDDHGAGRASVNGGTFHTAGQKPLAAARGAGRYARSLGNASDRVEGGPTYIINRWTGHASITDDNDECRRWARLVAGIRGDLIAVSEESPGTFIGRTSVSTAELFGQQTILFPSHYGGEFG